MTKLAEMKKTEKAEKKSFLDDVDKIGDMTEKELHESFLKVKKFVSAIGNKASQSPDKQLFDTSVVVLKIMNMYSVHLNKNKN